MQGNRVVKLDKEHRHKHVSRLVETTHESTENTLWNQQEKNGRKIAKNKSVFINVIMNKGDVC